MATKSLPAETSVRREPVPGLRFLWIGMIVFAAASAAGFVYCTFELHKLSIHDKVTVGMTQADVADRLGEPHEVIRAGDADQPPQVGPHSVTRKNANEIHRYMWGARVVYVYFDPGDVVIAYYVCQT